MSSRIGPDSPIHQVLSWISTLVITNLVGLGLGLPLVTGGLSLIVMIVVSIRLIEDEATEIGPSLRLTLHGLPAVLIVFLVEAVLGALLAWEWLISANLASSRALWLMRSILGFLTLILAVAHVWLWPMLGHRLINTGSVRVSALPSLVTASILVGVAHLHRTAVALVVLVAPFALALLSLQWALRVGFYFLVFGLAFGAYICVATTHSMLRSQANPQEDTANV